MPPATAAAAATPPRIRTSRRAGFIADQRSHLGDPRAVHHFAGLRGLERHTFVPGVEDRQPERRSLPQERQHAHRVRAISRVTTAFPCLVRKIAIQEEDLYFLHAVGKELQLDFRIGSGDAFEHRSGQVRIELLEREHGVERNLAQLGHALRMLFGLVQRKISAQLRFDLLIAGKGLALGDAQLTGRLALRQGEIVDAVLGHQPRGGGSDARSGIGLPVALATHCGNT